MEVEDSPEETAAKMTALESCVIFLLMSKYDNHQHDMMHRLHKQFSSTVEGSEIHISPVFKQTLQLFVTDEIIPTPFEGQEFLESHSSVHKISSINAELPSKFVTLLKDRVIQHNIRVVAKYYKRIRSARLCQLLRLTQDELEMYLSELSGDGDIPIRIDRPAGIITFQQKKSAEETLSDWSYDVTKMLQLTESTCHLINREIMVHKVQ